MNEIVFNKKSLLKTRFDIYKRKLISGLLFIFKLLIWWWLSFLGRTISAVSQKVYDYLFPKRVLINKIAIILIMLYAAGVASWTIYLRYNQKPIDQSLLLSIPGIILVYIIIRFVLWLYYVFVGVYQLLEEQVIWTIEYVVKYKHKLLKIYGITGAGKDTTMAGMASILSVHFKDKTIMDMEYIRSVCYFIDFQMLDLDLNENYKDYLTFSKEYTEIAFLGDDNTIGLAPERNYYIKSHYIKSGVITPKMFINDYYNFKKNPVMYNSKFTTGVNVSKKHFLDLIMHEYIQWWIRINIEKNFLIMNQPFLEDFQTGLMAKQFSFNMLRTKVLKTKVKNPTTNKLEERVEKVFFPWKDRLVLGETECGTWYMNRDKNNEGIMLSGGARDFKAYNRQFMNDFHWFQVDQAAERTSAFFRELDHGYLAVLSREEKPGGTKKNLLLKIALKFINWRISREDNRKLKADNKKIKKQQKIDDLQALYNATSNIYYKEIINKIKVKTKFRYRRFYEKYKMRASSINRQIESNLKDGYIYVTVAISKHPTTINEFKPTTIKKIIQEKKYNDTFVTQLVFRTSDCERYDTRYLRNLAEERAKKTVVKLAEVPPWPINFKFGKKEMEWACYEAAKSQFGISDKAYEELRFGDGYKNHIKQI